MKNIKVRVWYTDGTFQDTVVSLTAVEKSLHAVGVKQNKPNVKCILVSSVPESEGEVT